MKPKDLIDVASGNGNHYFRCMIRPGAGLYDDHSYLDGLYRNEEHEVPVYTNEGVKDEYKDGTRCYDHKDDTAREKLEARYPKTGRARELIGIEPVGYNSRRDIKTAMSRRVTSVMARLLRCALFLRHRQKSELYAQYVSILIFGETVMGKTTDRIKALEECFEQLKSEEKEDSLFASFWKSIGICRWIGNGAGSGSQKKEWVAVL
jgi:hypothetical protein